MEKMLSDSEQAVRQSRGAEQDTGRSKADADPTLCVCTECGHLGHTVVVTRGALRTELILWLALIVPGLLYSLWRLTTRALGCQLCQGRHVIPASSPIGKKLLAELS